MMELWTTKGADWLTHEGAQSREEQIQRQTLYDPAIEEWLLGFLDLWLGSQPEPTMAV